jgi:phospholipase C
MKKFGWILLLLAQQAVAGTLPRPDHVVVVIEENKAYAQIIGNHDAPYINGLAARGMLLTRSYGVTHPSQPNYLALFSGSTRRITSDGCPLELEGDNLALVLRRAGLSFAVYSESLPAAGSAECVYGGYRRKHNPAADWAGLAAVNLPFTAFPRDFTQLPTVSWVIPDQRNDMHDGSIAQGDAWLRENLDAYANWAMRHNSLLIVTWDEDNGSADNHIATILIGQMVKPGSSAQRVSHYHVLRTIEQMYRLPYLNESTRAGPIVGVWR